MPAISRRTSLRTSARATEHDLPVADVWAVVASGEARPQWYVDALPWRVRGAIDRATGGAGRRWSPPGRARLRAGDTAGFWRVVESEWDPDRPDGVGRLVLDAVVRAPGTVTLRVTATPLAATRTRLETAVTFLPSGVLGAAYLLTDLPAREVVMELAHRRLTADLPTPTGT